MRARWSMSPCSAPTLKPCLDSERWSVATSRLRLQKMMAFLKLSAPRISARSTARLSTGSRPDGTMYWLMVVAAVAGFEASTRTGLDRNWSARRLISGGMVAEKNRVWRVNGQQLADALDVGDEAHVEHAVGLVDDQDLDAGHQDLAALEQVEQAAGRGDEDVDAAVELLELVVEGDAADDQRHGQLVVAAVAVEALLDLRGEFARRLEDQRARHARPGAALFEQGQHGQDEGGGLAGAGLGDADDIAARQRMGDRLRLDGRRLGVAAGLNRGQDFRAQSERFESSCVKR